MIKAYYNLIKYFHFPVHFHADLLCRFPYTQKGAPEYIKCDLCTCCGWGPMLTDYCWAEIKSVYVFREKKRNRQFLCEDCMQLILQRPLYPWDIRKCPMNINHRFFDQIKDRMDMD